METAIALLMMFAGNTSNLQNTILGDFYQPTSSVYEVSTNKTYVVWERYHVSGEKYGTYGTYNTSLLHLQVRSYNGKITKEELKNDGRKRNDTSIEIVSM